MRITKPENKIWNVIKENTQFYIFILLVVLLPFTKKYLPYIMFLWVLSGVLNLKKDLLKPLKSNILLLFPLVFYFIQLIGVFYSDDFKNGIFDLEVKLTIFFLPFIIIFVTQRVVIKYRLVLKIFVFSNLVASIICLAVAVYNSFHIGESGTMIFETSAWPTLTKGYGFIKLINLRFSYFSYNYLSIFHHSSYFSMYILFSVAILVYLLRSTERKKYGYYFLIAYFTVFIWLLSSRAAYITYLICLVSFFLILIFQYKKYWIGMLVLLIGITLASVALSNKQLRKNVNETIQLFKQKSLNKNSDMRLWIWRSGIEVLKDQIIFGVGTGDIDDALNKKYKEYNLELANEHSYNAHNQYLDVALKTGLVGLIIFLTWMINLIYITIKRKQFLFFYFTVILLTNFFFEVILNVISGVSFFVFFYSLLYVKYDNLESKD